MEKNTEKSAMGKAMRYFSKGPTCNQATANQTHTPVFVIN